MYVYTHIYNHTYALRQTHIYISQYINIIMCIYNHIYIIIDNYTVYHFIFTIHTWVCTHVHTHTLSHSS